MRPAPWGRMAQGAVSAGTKKALTRQDGGFRLRRLARRGECEGGTFAVPPLAFSHPPAGDHFCASKSAGTKKDLIRQDEVFFGASLGIRTPDTLLKRQVLYLLS